MTMHYLRDISPAVTHDGEPVDRGIDVAVRSVDGADWVLRLIPGYDPYMTVIIVNNGEYGFYRFDRRMRSMSDEAELRGLGLRALHQILRDCERNLKSSKRSIYFIDHFTGDLEMPFLQRDNFKYSIKNKNLTVMSLSRTADNNFSFGFTVTVRALFTRMKVNVERLADDTATLLQTLAKDSYGRKCTPNFERLFSSK